MSSQPEGAAGAQPPERSPAPAAGGPPAGAGGPGDSGPGDSGPAAAVVRASDRERDAAVTRLQVAFAQGRLDDEEFDRRVRAALVGGTRGDLERVVADLPAEQAGADAAVPAAPASRSVVAFKGSVRRRGRWRVPERSRALTYKGTCELDLRAAELPGPVTEITAVAYKSHVEVIVPPGVRVEFHGSGYGGSFSDPDWQEDLPADAPVVRVRGFAYKGSVQASTLPRRQRDR